jgi:amidase
MAQEFVVSRTVRDIAAMLDAVSQPAPGDPFIIVQPQRPYSQEVNAPPGKLRIAWTTKSWKPGTEVQSDVIECVNEVAAKCEEMGHEVVEDSPVFEYEEYLRALCVAWAAGFDAATDSLAATMNRKISNDTLEPITLSYYNFSRALTTADIIRASAVLNKLRRNFGQFFQQYDVLLTPTLSQPAESLGKYALTRTDLDFIGYFRLCDEMNMHIPLFNVTGQPAISLPLGQSKSGLPIGAQFVAKFGEEGALIRLASAFEKAMPWRARIPPVHVSR